MDLLFLRMGDQIAVGTRNDGFVVEYFKNFVFISDQPTVFHFENRAQIKRRLGDPPLDTFRKNILIIYCFGNGLSFQVFGNTNQLAKNMVGFFFGNDVVNFLLYAAVVKISRLKRDSPEKCF